MNRRGFAWYEVLFVLVAIGSVTGFAIPKYEDYKRQEVAAVVVADIDTLRSAVYRFYSDSGYFPRQGGYTVTPENLGAYLPQGYSFRRSYGTLDYKNWTLLAPYGATKASNVVGVSVVTTDPKVGAAATAQYGDDPRFNVGQNRVFIFFGG